MMIMIGPCLLQSMRLHLFRFVRPLLKKMSALFWSGFSFHAMHLISLKTKFRDDEMAPTYVSTKITEGTRFLNGKKKRQGIYVWWGNKGKPKAADWHPFGSQTPSHAISYSIHNPLEFKPKWKKSDSCKCQGSRCCFHISSFSVISGKTHMR